jgi:stage II sporulation protein AA (anti-sigma F factor antagonist)
MAEVGAIIGLCPAPGNGRRDGYDRPNSSTRAPMPIAYHTAGAVQVASLDGQLNSHNAVEAESELLARVAPGARMLLDFTRLDYISSAGLRVVLVLAKRLKQADGRLVLCGMQPHVHEVFDISGFLSILDVAGSRDEALGRLAA